MTYGYLMHHGVKGQKWGVRRYQNPDGSLTSAGRKRYGMVKDNNQTYFGTAKGFVKAYSKDEQKLYKQMKADIKEDKTLSKEEKKTYKKNAKQIINNFLDEKYDMNVTQLRSNIDDTSYPIVKGLINSSLNKISLKLGGDGQTHYVPPSVAKFEQNRLYRIENNKKTGISTLYDRKGREITNSKNRIENKRESNRFGKAVGGTAWLRTQYPKDMENIYSQKQYDNEITKGINSYNTYFKEPEKKQKKKK